MHGIAGAAQRASSSLQAPPGGEPGVDEASYRLEGGAQLPCNGGVDCVPIVVEEHGIRDEHVADALLLPVHAESHADQDQHGGLRLRARLDAPRRRSFRPERAHGDLHRCHPVRSELPEVVISAEATFAGLEREPGRQRFVS